MFTSVFIQKLTPSTSYKGSSTNGRDQSIGKLETPANRGFLSRIKSIFFPSDGEKKVEEKDNKRGIEWLLEGENEANGSNMRSESNDDINAFGEEKCNSLTEVGLLLRTVIFGF